MACAGWDGSLIHNEFQGTRPSKNSLPPKDHLPLVVRRKAVSVWKSPPPRDESSIGQGDSGIAHRASITCELGMIGTDSQGGGLNHSNSGRLDRAPDTTIASPSPSPSDLSL